MHYFHHHNHHGHHYHHHRRHHHHRDHHRYHHLITSHRTRHIPYITYHVMCCIARVVPCYVVLRFMWLISEVFFFVSRTFSDNLRTPAWQDHAAERVSADWESNVDKRTWIVRTQTVLISERQTRGWPRMDLGGDRISPSSGGPRWTGTHRGHTLFYCAITSYLSQRLLHKMTNSRTVLIARQTARNSIVDLDTFWYVSWMYLSQHKFAELALGKFYLDFHRVTWPWRWTLTNGSDVKYTVVSWNCARDLRRSNHSALLGVQIWWLAFFVRSQGKCSGHRRGQVGAGITHHRHTRRGLRWGGHTRFHSPWLSLAGGGKGGWRGGWGWWWRPVCHFQVTGSEWQMIWRCVVFAERLALETLPAYH